MSIKMDLEAKLNFNIPIKKIKWLSICQVLDMKTSLIIEDFFVRGLRGLSDGVSRKLCLFLSSEILLKLQL